MAPARRRFARSGIALVLTTLLLLSAVPGVVAAEQRAGGTVVVAEGETVDGDLEAFGGTIIVRGTVNGDVEAFGGDVRIEGNVAGDVDAAAGNVWVLGTVSGNVDLAAGNVYVQPGSEIGGRLSVAAGNIVVAGSVGGNANLAGGSITLAETATFGGNVEYAADAGGFTDRGASVGGTITQVEDLDAGPWTGPVVPGWALSVYGLLVNLLLGALLLLVFPGFTTAVAERVVTDPLRTGGVGVLTLILVPVLLVLLAVTIVGIPLAFVGALLFGLAVWVALVLGRFAVGAWLLSLADVENRWAALVVGLVLLALLASIPWIGWIFDLAVVLLGLGGMAAIGYAGYRTR